MASNYTGNSNIKREMKDQPEKRKVQQVTKGKVKVKKKSEFKKIASSIIAEEATSLKEYAIYEVVVPVIRDTISQLIKGCTDMLFYGKPSDYRGHSRRSNVSRVSYTDYYDRRDRRDERRSERPFSYDDITFETKDDAVIVLENMDAILEEYQVVRVSDLFDLAGQSGNVDTNFNYGWTNLRTASIERNRYGEWFIKLPRPCCIR